jgi:hypothetical protein
VNSGSIRVAVSVVNASSVSGYCVARVHVVLREETDIRWNPVRSARQCRAHVFVAVDVLVTVLQAQRRESMNERSQDRSGTRQTYVERGVAPTGIVLVELINTAGSERWQRAASTEVRHSRSHHFDSRNASLAHGHDL